MKTMKNKALSLIFYFTVMSTNFDKREGDVYFEFIKLLFITYLQHYHSFNDKDQLNTKCNHAKDLLKVPSGSITKVMAKVEKGTK